MTSESLRALLDLQERDTTLDQLRRRRDGLTERVERDEAAARLEAIRERAAETSDRRDELLRDQRRHQDEAAVLDEKRQAHQATLYDGSITNPRELQDLQEEIESLGRRIGEIEDRELEVMEELEPVETELASIAEEEADVGRDLDRAEAELLAAEAEIDARVAEVQPERDELTIGVDPALLEEYEGFRRARGGGIAAARLQGNRCGGCNLEVSAVAVAAMKKNPGEAARCEECGCILVP